MSSMALTKDILLLIVFFQKLSEAQIFCCYRFVKLLTAQANNVIVCSKNSFNSLPKLQNFHKKSLTVYQIEFTAHTPSTNC